MSLSPLDPTSARLHIKEAIIEKKAPRIRKCSRKGRICTIIPPHMTGQAGGRHDGQTNRSQAHQNTTLCDKIRKKRAKFHPTESKVAGTPQFLIYDAKTKQRLPGSLVANPASLDKAVNEAYKGAKATYDFYLKNFNQNSIDGKGMSIISSVHYGLHYENAFWDGQQMVYGDGDDQYQYGDPRKIFDRFTIDQDVITHEITHGITDNSPSPLVYSGQSGALNEHVSDAFGIMAKQCVRFNQGLAPQESDWLIGENVLVDYKGKVYALRSMKAPGTAYVNHPLLGTDPQPGSMDAYVNMTDDNGGVHINSGIPNHAFYLAATALGGHSWEKAGKIWYETMHGEGLRPTANFKQFAKTTIKSAVKLYGAGSAEEAAMRSAWKTVKVLL